MAPDCRNGECSACFMTIIKITVHTVNQFKYRLTMIMIVDFAGCWVVEVVCKHLFADLEPKSMVTRGRERREQRRRAEEQERTQNGVVAEAEKKSQ